MSTDKNTEQLKRKEAVGVVVSDKMHKTITVISTTMVKHEKYGKYIKRTTVMKAHDEKNAAKVGDKVSLYQVRPLSKTKRWMLQKVLELAKA